MSQLEQANTQEQAGERAAAKREVIGLRGQWTTSQQELVAGAQREADAKATETLQAVAKEAISNVARHARAKMVLVTLSFLGGSVDIVIQDDGDGASELILRNYQESSTHFGLKGLRKLVTGAGGRFEVGNGEESGLVVKARFPLAAEDPA